MKKQLLLLRRLSFFLIAMISCIYAEAQTNQFRGVNWADKRDNFQPGIIYISGLSSSDTYASASIVADKVVSQFMGLFGSNSVRLPINEATVSSTYWNTYKGAIDVALTKGKVILCFWSESSGAQVKDMNAFWSTWQKVVTQYGNNPNMYFEVFNEPSHLNKTDLRTLYFNWLQKYPSFPQNRVILDGSGLAMNVSDIGSDSRFDKCLLAVHEYSFFGSTSSVKESDWQNQIKAFVGNYANRTVCTEWGGPMAPGTKNNVYYDKMDYNKPASNFFEAYVRGVSNQLREWKMGSFYWPGLRDNDWYSLTTRTGEGANIKLTVNNQSGLDRVKYSWGNYTQVPVVAITQPTATTYLAPATIPITATATVTGGTISKVEFYNGTTKLGEDLTSPYTYTWANVAMGSYSITAIATDNLGNKTTSSQVAIKVNLPQVPVVAITQPTATTFLAPATIPITATATVTGGTISKVEFYNGTTKLGEDVTSPYTDTWTNVAKGSYSITAVATDNLGNKTTSSQVAIKVNVPQAPYNGTWSLIPGVIQAENYDVGGNGSAYSDGSAGNIGGATFRTDEDVDIENCTDVGTGYNIGTAAAGEWLEYSVDVKTAGTYDIDFRVAANGAGRTISLTMDGVGIANNVAIPNTGGWQTWQTVTVNGVSLTAGNKIMRLTIGATDYVNLNYVTFKLTKELKQEPFNGTAFSIPGKIEAENYDLGGEGIAYHEANTNGNQGNSTLRDDEVDIETTQDVGGGYNIAYILKGEWLEYTIDVAATGMYNLDLRLAADGDGKLFHVEVDGVNVSGAVNVPNKGGWQTWETVTVNNITLTEGEHVIRLAFESDYMNLNYIAFRNEVTTGVRNKKFADIHVYPNPFGNEGFVIEGNECIKYTITTIDGQEIETGTCTSCTRIGSNLTSGMYLINIQQKENFIIQKMIKK